MSTCSKCGEEVEDGSTFCPYCGEKLSQQVCPVCGEAIGQGYFACMHCGADLLAPNANDQNEKTEAFEINLHERLQ